MTQQIMVVDDDPMIRFLVQEYLTAVGYSVTACGGGAEALSSLQSFTPDLIILDLQMPEMNGLEVIENLKRTPETENIPVLLLSANASDAKSERGVTADHYLEKPFQMSDFLAAVKSTTRSAE
jgi:CheY-like chemotaxis protein